VQSTILDEKIEPERALGLLLGHRSTAVVFIHEWTASSGKDGETAVSGWDR